MDNIRSFIEAIKAIQMSQVIDIILAILIYILFRCTSKSLAYMTVKIFKPRTKSRLNPLSTTSVDTKGRR